MRPAADTAMQVPADSGATAQAEEESTYHLSADERDHLHFLEAEISSDPSEDPDGFVEQAHDAARNLPSSLLRRLRRFARFGSCHGVLRIRGHRIGHVPPTPPDNTHYLGEKTGLAKQQAIISSILGEMIAYEAEGAGKLFQDIVPARRMAERQVSVGSLIELEAHTEQAHSPCRPDHLLLGCLRGDPTAVTFVWTARQVLDCLTDVEIALAREPLWMTGVDESFRHDGVDFKLGDIRGPMPILYGDSADPFMVVDQDLMHGTTNAASALLAHVVRAFTVRRKGIVLQPGDLLVVDNRRTMHGRSSFVPKFDGCDRFVLRCFTCHDLGRLREARPDGSRTVAAAFS